MSLRKKLLLTLLAVAVLALIAFFMYIIIALSMHRNGALRDFDYMVAVIEKNYTNFGIHQRRSNIDVNEILASGREALVDKGIFGMWGFNFHEFLHFEVLSHVPSHLGGTPHWIYVHTINFIKRYPSGDNYTFSASQQRLLDVLMSPSVIRVYGEVTVDVENNYGFEPYPNNVITRIYADESMAYLAFSWFPATNIEYDRQALLDFFKEISYLHHLVIDLRNHPGGFTRYFKSLVIAPNINERMYVEVFGFLSGGAKSLSEMNAFVEDMYAMYNVLIDVMPIYQILETYNLPYFNEYDLQWLDYGYKHIIVVEPAFEDALFDGKIWILMNHRTESAAEQAAIISKYSGFATIVGEPTNGFIGGVQNLVALPFSGFLLRYPVVYKTDSYGRAFYEFGVIPHFHIDEDEDAFEVVRLMIRGQIR